MLRRPGPGRGRKGDQDMCASKTSQQRALDLLYSEGLADAVAEAMLAHDECCGMRSAAALLLDVAGVEFEQFLINWMAGAYDGRR